MDYLPMHAITKESSTSPKLRVVFEASAPASNGISLNGSLLVGPTLHPKLETILLRFRTYPVAITADISKISSGRVGQTWQRPTQIRVESTAIWHGDRLSDDPGHLRSHSLSLLGHQSYPANGSRLREHHPIASSQVYRSFYVYDLLAGARIPEDALALHTSLRALLLKGGFNLCKWRSSSPLVTMNIDPSLREKLPVKDITDSQNSPHPKALGLDWHSGADTMSTSLNLTSCFAPTKRGIISDFAKTFDVLGWISPRIIMIKILYQQLWEGNLTWDEEIPQSYQVQHLTWHEQLPLLTSKHLSRCYFRVDTPYQCNELTLNQILYECHYIHWILPVSFYYCLLWDCNVVIEDHVIRQASCFFWLFKKLWSKNIVSLWISTTSSYLAALHWRSRQDRVHLEFIFNIARFVRLHCHDWRYFCCSNHKASGATREVFRKGEWSQWICHFENIAAVNSWNEECKLLWLKVRLTERAQLAFQHLPENAQANYGEARKALKERFDPESRKNRYRTEFQMQRKKTYWRLARLWRRLENSSQQSLSSSRASGKRPDGSHALSLPNWQHPGYFQRQTAKARNTRCCC